MQVYWREVRKGQRLILTMDDGQEQEVGGVRATKRGFDAFAQTFGYDPGRAQKGMAGYDGLPTRISCRTGHGRPWRGFYTRDRVLRKPA